jgi:hypothetical protein
MFVEGFDHFGEVGERAGEAVDLELTRFCGHP